MTRSQYTLFRDFQESLDRIEDKIDGKLDKVEQKISQANLRIDGVDARVVGVEKWQAKTAALASVVGAVFSMTATWLLGFVDKRL